MTVEEIFNKIATHMTEGIMIHDYMQQGYDFLNFYGYSRCQEYHYIEEVKDYKKLSHYYSTHYHRLLQIGEIAKPDFLSSSWYKYTSIAFDTNTRRQAVQTLMRKWVEWEQETKKLYSEMYIELYKLNEIAAANEIKYYICAVDKELKNAEKKLVELETIDYNIETIMDWQKAIHKKYKKKLK